MAYGTSADVASRLARAGVDEDFAETATAKPRKSTVVDWLKQASIRLDARILSAGFDPSTASADGKEILEDAIVGFVAGRVERLWAGVTEGEPNKAGHDLMMPLLELLERLTREPERIAVELGIPTAVGSSLASFHTDSADATDTSVTPDRTFKVTSKF